MFIECGGYVINTEDIRYITPVKHNKEIIKGGLVELASCFFTIHFLTSSDVLGLEYEDVEQARKDRNKLVEQLTGKID